MGRTAWRAEDAGLHALLDQFVDPARRSSGVLAVNLCGWFVTDRPTVYVVPGSDAEWHLTDRFPSKRTKHVAMSLRANSIDGLVEGLPLIFQREQAKDMSATYHFTCRRYSC
ncbi:hypothetical protein [Streptomyces cellulosae]|uniref:Uncharacterized protein n=1 Tax=Streptomyces cellulosae TaxID=1968 RepID=A0ABW7YHX1_STRCE